MSIRKWVSVLLGVLGIVLAMVAPVGAQADFGLKSASVVAEEADGSVDLQAGSHPFAYKVNFALNPGTYGFQPLRSVIVDLPTGFIGNPQAVPQCSAATFDAGGINSLCPGITQVGEIEIVYGQGVEPVVVHNPIFNLSTPVGVPARIGFSLVNLNGFQEASLRPGDYGVSVSDLTLPSVELRSLTETIWGVPADPRHDPFRQCVAGGVLFLGCASEAPERPFLSLPTSCAGPLVTTFSVDALENPGVFDTATAHSLDENGAEAPLENCEAEPFKPTLSARPQTAATDSPTGLDVGIEVPQSENPKGLATAHLKDVSVSLPAGLAVNPSAADGLAACALEGPEGVNLPRSSDPTAPEPAAVGEAAKCPAASKIGTVAVKTPLLDHSVPGEVFLARQGANPFGSLIALYIALDDPISGTVVKIAGKVEPDPVTGQLRATFLNNPQLPVEDLDLSFFGGSRATLTTPSTCGTYTSNAALTPWSSPEGPTALSQSSFALTQSPAGGCPATEAQMPNSPGFEAGTTQSLAGAYSPFVLKLTRGDGSQRLGAITTTLPEGMLGRLAGVPYCTDAQIAAASARSGEGEGALEQSSPSCPEASRVGVVSITAGSGSEPYPVQGKAYLAGPYKNAPLSLAIITPAIAGPFDLGTVVVRVALYINASTSQIHAVSDPLPTILDGIPLDLRSVSLSMDRAGFTFNPTSCEAMSVTGEAVSTLGQTAGLSNRFQVGGCQGLPFKPAMIITTQGKTSKANGASLTVKVSQKPGEANIHKVDLTLPKVLPARLTTLQQACTEAQFAANPAGCPAGSFIGTAKAVTPILSVPLTGPAILVSHGGAAFPDVVFLLQANERGSDIRIDLDGKTDIKKGVTYSRFETIPDAPITSFETNLPEGPHSVLAATGNLCTSSKLAIPTALTGQNGAQINQSTPVTVTGCPKAKVLTRAQKLKLALKACHKKPKGKKRQACEKAARHKYGPVIKRKGKKQ